MIDDLKNKLLSLGGEKVDPVITGWDEFLPAILEHGTAYDTKTQPVFGVLLCPGHCHDNATLISYDFPEVEVWTGFALSPKNEWINHSWGFHPDWGIIETTGYFQKYFGVKMPVEFVTGELINAEECRETLGLPKGLKDLVWSKTHKKCSTCGDEKLLTAFNKDGSNKDGLRSYCRECGQKYWTGYYSANAEKRRAEAKKYRLKDIKRCRAAVRKSHYKTKYGLTLEDLEEMRKAQNNRCGCCEDELGSMQIDVDHCHQTGKVRALLCSNCNNGLGRFKDDPERLQKAIRYLRRHSPLHSE